MLKMLANKQAVGVKKVNAINELKGEDVN